MMYCRQAIVTKYFGPTERLGSRVRVKCNARLKFIPWLSEFDSYENHARAAYAVAKDLGWLNRGERLIGGGLPSEDGYCFVIDAGDECEIKIKTNQEEN
jgi:hypothetical protein